LFDDDALLAPPFTQLAILGQHFDIASEKRVQRCLRILHTSFQAFPGSDRSVSLKDGKPLQLPFPLIHDALSLQYDESLGQNDRIAVALWETLHDAFDAIQLHEAIQKVSSDEHAPIPNGPTEVLPAVDQSYNSFIEQDMLLLIQLMEMGQNWLSAEQLPPQGIPTDLGIVLSVSHVPFDSIHFLVAGQ